MYKSEEIDKVYGHCLNVVARIMGISQERELTKEEADEMQSAIIVMILFESVGQRKQVITDMKLGVVVCLNKIKV